ncbi:hypothetical protein EK904_009106 [Melospiza melodia maxima]|nr:hypothetical protein EK904_009106 [Melospiza melodia maxima]
MPRAEEQNHSYRQGVEEHSHKQQENQQDDEAEEEPFKPAPRNEFHGLAGICEPKEGSKDIFGVPDDHTQDVPKREIWGERFGLLCQGSQGRSSAAGRPAGQGAHQPVVVLRLELQRPHDVDAHDALLGAAVRQLPELPRRGRQRGVGGQRVDLEGALENSNPSLAELPRAVAPPGPVDQQCCPPSPCWSPACIPLSLPGSLFLTLPAVIPSDCSLLRFRTSLRRRSCKEIQKSSSCIEFPTFTSKFKSLENQISKILSAERSLVNMIYSETKEYFLLIIPSQKLAMIPKNSASPPPPVGFWNDTAASSWNVLDIIDL